MIRSQTCPVCGRELPAEIGTESKLFPFCSTRCRQVDFFRWCEGRYAIVEPPDLPADSEVDLTSGDGSPEQE